MSRWRILPLSKIVEATGGAAGAASALPVYSVTKHRGFVPSLEYFSKQVFSRDLSDYTVLRPGEVAYATIHLDEGSIGICPEPCLISPMYTAFKITTRDVHCPYVVRYLKSPRALAEYPRLGKGSIERRRSISLERLGTLEIPLPPLSEQLRVAETLDLAEALRAKRRAALAQLDTLTQSIFLDMFGDPATNPKGWPTQSVGSVASRFSDGPFGSNLKTEHYTESGIRVIRLQNIGVGAFIGDDKAFVSAAHFARLQKHECRPGDVLVATMGDPNLRACIQPDWLPCALNKADCVQLRPDQKVANAAYLSGLINQPTTELMAQELMRGQTRVRISMGRLRGLKIPVPPLSLQHEFAARLTSVERLRNREEAALAELDALFASLQHRAFNGEL